MDPTPNTSSTPTRPATADEARDTLPPSTPTRADLEAPDAVVVTTVTVVTATALPEDAAADSTVATEAAAEAPLRPEDVHVRPPDHLPEGVTPEAENVELIFERS